VVEHQFHAFALQRVARIEDGAHDLLAHRLRDARAAEQRVELVDRRQAFEVLGRVGAAGDALAVGGARDDAADRLLGR
jgi:hypothetical protein